jgi:flagellar protein FliS
MAIQNDLYNQFQRNKINTQVTEIELKTNHISSPTSVNKNNVHEHYQQNMVNTSSPQELTLMLYNGLIKFLNMSIQGIEEKSIEKSNNNIIKSQNIIGEFMSTLDMNYEVSSGLLALYDYMNRRLKEANIHKDKAIVEEVLGFAEELRDTWAQAMKLVKQQAVSK